MTIKWKRPSGNPLETNDSKETITYLESLGYTQIKGGGNQKEELATYALKAFGVELDMKKRLKTLQKEVDALESE